MAAPPPRPGHGLLRCPVCRLHLTAAAGALACSNRHSFDLTRDGYLNLLRNGRYRPAKGGDSREQLRRRAAFLEAGHFDAVASLIASQVRNADAKPADKCWRVLDAVVAPDITSPVSHTHSKRRWPVWGSTFPNMRRTTPHAAGRSLLSPSPIYGVYGRCKTPWSTSSSTFSRQRISPRRRGCSGQGAGWW